MKHLLLPLVLLLAISLPHITATGGANATQLVYDTDGHEMMSYSSYYILPAQKGTGGGGLKLDSLCLTPMASSFVIQARGEADHGDPVQFRPLSAASSDGKTRLLTDTKIVFAIFTTRAESLYWYVKRSWPPLSSLSSSEPPHQRVAISEYLKRPHGFVFRVERHAVIAGGAAKGYKLVWCHDGEMKPCRDLGLYEFEGKTWLVTSDSPFVVVFKKQVD